jgi:hypothetical protein
MKNLLAFLIFVGASLGLNAQVTATSAKPESLSFKENSFDFGKILQSRPVTHEFEISNTSPDTLKIADVKASCGCTTPVWKKEPVAPGGSTVLNVGYNAAAMGAFERTVTVYYNDHQTKTITIKGEVIKAPATAAPQNTSIQLLKQTNL